MNVKNNTIRVRFAPSPTGHLHIGGLRTALFNWLFARHFNGTYLVRIEDTDKQRSKQEYVESIMQSFDWCQIKADEPIVMQSDRISEHQKVAERLVEEGKAYRCYCIPEEIVSRLKQKDGYNDLFSMYDRYCLGNEQKLDKPFVIRFKIPETTKAFSFTDLIRGPISFEKDQFDDFIIVRSDGSPTYNLVVVLDDAYMKVSHIIRGEDHIANTPKQILLYQACNLPLPEFAHLPLILGQSGQRLSKRDAATSVLDYKKSGYLPKGLLNYLVRLGWSHGDQEIFTIDELINYFSLKNIGKKGSIFDMTKLDWLNGLYIRSMQADEIISYIIEYIDKDFFSKFFQWNKEQVFAVIDAYKDRVKTLQELIEKIKLLHDGATEYDKKSVDKWVKKETISHLQGPYSRGGGGESR